MSRARLAGGASGDPATLRGLTAARSLAREQADELLTHLPVIGDLATQRLLDTWVEQAADTLRAISEAAEERLLELGSRAASVTTPDAVAPVTAPRSARPGAPR